MQMALNICAGGKRPVLSVVMRRAADEHNVSAPFIDHRPGVAAGRHEGPRASAAALCFWLTQGNSLLGTATQSHLSSWPCADRCRGRHGSKANGRALLHDLNSLKIPEFKQFKFKQLKEPGSMLQLVPLKEHKEQDSQ